MATIIPSGKSGFLFVIVDLHVEFLLITIRVSPLPSSPIALPALSMKSMNHITPFLAATELFNGNEFQIAERATVVIRMHGFIHVLVAPLARMATNKITTDPSLFWLLFDSVFDERS